MLDAFYMSSFFPSVTLIKYVSSYRKMYCEPMNNAIGTSTGINGVRLAHHSETGDLSLLLFVFFFLQNSA